MNRLRFVILLTIAAAAVFACRTIGSASTGEKQISEPPIPEKFSVVRLDPAEGELSDLLRTEVQKANQLGRVPYVEFYADWCPPCNAIRDSLSDTRMVEAFEGAYIIQLDLDRWKSSLAGTGFNVRGIPVFFEVDAQGKPTGRFITGGAWGEDIPANMAPPLKAFFHGADTEA